MNAVPIHPATAARREAARVAAQWTSAQPAEELVWALGLLSCDGTCLAAVWSGQDHPALHRETLHGAVYIADRSGTQLRPFSLGGQQRKVGWAEIGAFLGEQPAPHIRATAALIRQVEDERAALVPGPHGYGPPERARIDRDLRVLALEAWMLLRPGRYAEDAGGQLALFAGAAA